MAKKINTIEPEELESKTLALIKAIGRNEARKPQDRVQHTVTVLTEEDRGLMVCGSAHRMTDLFVALIKKRPEYRQVLEEAIRKYGSSNNWKL